MFNNFLYRVAQYLHDNRARLIRVALILAAILLAVFLIFAGVERWKERQYQKRLQSLDQQFQQSDADAKAAQARADAKQEEIDILKAEHKQLEARAAAAENAVQQTRTVVVPLKEKYEEARNTPVDTTDPACADVCRELADLGHPCR
jgi:Tfp pilus assembly protein PilN